MKALVIFSFILSFWLCSISLHAQAQLLSTDSKKSGAVEKLIPANFQTHQDRKGNSWRVQSHGEINRTGSSMLSSGESLYINNQQFYSGNKTFMTEDKLEYVLRGSQNYGGLNVYRRIRVYEREGCLRYLEIFENKGMQTITTNISVRSSFGSRFKTMVSNLGTPSPTDFPGREFGVIVNPSSGNYNSFLYVMAGREGVKPTIATTNSYQMRFDYPIVVPPGEVRCVMHVVSQAKQPARMDAKSLQPIFRPLELHNFISLVPKKLRGFIINLPSTNADPLLLFGSSQTAALGVDRSTRDILAVGKETRMLGTATCSRLEVETVFGTAEVSFADVAALTGENHGQGRVSRVYLNDGQILSGVVTAEELRFTLFSGAVVDLSISKLDRLVRKEVEMPNHWPDEIEALIQTFDGDRVAIGNSDIEITAVTPWGTLPIPLEELLWLAPPEGDDVGYRLRLRDGSRFFAFLSEGDFSFRSELFGEKEIRTTRIHTIITRSAIEATKDKDQVEIQPTQPYLELIGNQRLMARVASEKLTVVTPTETMEFSPETLRSVKVVENEEKGSREFQILPWGGGNVVAMIYERMIPVTFRGQDWLVPLPDIVEMVTPVPQISEKSQARIAELIRQLGDEDWQVREDSTRELQDFGFMAKGMISEALNLNRDAEVRRRLEKLIILID